MSTQDVPEIWHEVTEKIKTRVVLPALWRAMEGARAITVDENRFILGFSPEAAHGAGLLMDSKNLNIIEQALEEVAGQPWRLKIIHGQTMEDWQEQKQREQETAAYTRTLQERRKREAGVEQNWEAVSERLTRRYAELPLRGLPQTQAAFLEEALGVIEEAMGRLMPRSPSEMDQRGLARVIDKVADRCGVPSPMIAYLLRQRRPT
jgi:hypothetical protein